MKQHAPYRGFSKIKKEWVYGFLYEDTPIYCVKEDIETMGREFSILVPGFADWGMPRPMEKYPVTESSVGMYTGVCVNLNGNEYPIYTNMRLDVCDANGRRKNLVVKGPVGGCFVCGGDEYPDTPLGDLLEIHNVSDPETM